MDIQFTAYGNHSIDGGVAHWVACLTHSWSVVSPNPITC